MEEHTTKKTTPDKSNVHPLNVIMVMMEDLTEANRKEGAWRRNCAGDGGETEWKIGMLPEDQE
jgi:hypothetical protein